jgi:DMSO/TMAO reductase YedYZ molybdopterin-dependent catalytic subunit
MHRRSLLIGAQALLAPSLASNLAPSPAWADIASRDSPLSAFTSPITANDRFFVRDPQPNQADLARWKLQIGGDAATRPISLGLAELNALPQQEFAALCQCPLPPPRDGARLGPFPMGCALWRGPRLRDVLAKAGLAQAMQMAFRGLSSPSERSIPLSLAMSDDTIVATGMNGVTLPIPQGFPARLIVAGRTGIFWTKSLATLDIRREAMSTSEPAELPINSLATSHADGDSVRGAGFTLAGQAWDGGSGIARVEISITRGATWGTAMLGPEESRYAFRPWSIQLAAAPGGLHPMIRATSNAGAMQPTGTQPNAIQTLHLIAA